MSSVSTSSYFLSASSAKKRASFNWFSRASIRSSSASERFSSILRALYGKLVEEMIKERKNRDLVCFSVRWIKAGFHDDVEIQSINAENQKLTQKMSPNSVWHTRQTPNRSLTNCRRVTEKFLSTSSYFLSASSAINFACDNCASNIATLSSSIFVRFSRAFLILIVYDMHENFKSNFYWFWQKRTNNRDEEQILCSTYHECSMKFLFISWKDSEKWHTQSHTLTVHFHRQQLKLLRA